ncbi:hypothetical protein [Helicobacter sp. 23-1046]
MKKYIPYLGFFVILLLVASFITPIERYLKVIYPEFPSFLVNAIPLAVMMILVGGYPLLLSIIQDKKQRRLLDVKIVMEYYFPNVDWNWDIFGGFGHTQQESVVLGESISDFIEFERCFLEYRTYLEYMVLQEPQDKLAGFRFKKTKQELQHDNKVRHYDKIIVSVSATPQVEFEKLGVDMMNLPMLYELQDSNKVSVVNFEVVCWFDITNHFGRESRNKTRVDSILKEYKKKINKGWQAMKNIQCKGCNESKAQNEFYLVDGGLKIEGIENLRFEVCKECIDKYQNSLKKNKYFDWQFITCYFIAQNSDSSSDFTIASENIDSGMPQGSTTMAVQNFLALFGKPNGLSNFSQQHQRVFHALHNPNGESLKDLVETIMEIDYQIFAQFQQKQRGKE